jgi:hypothetical protein
MAIEAPTQTDMAAGDEGSRLPRPDDDAVERASFVLMLMRRWLRWPRTSLERGHFSFRASIVVHALAMILLALWVEPRQTSAPALDLSAAWQAEEPQAATTEEPADFVAPNLDHAVGIESTAGTSASIDVPLVPQIDIAKAGDNNAGSRAAANAATKTSATPLPLIAGAIPRGGGLDGRARRQDIAFGRGGTPQSEAAVERGLNWLVAHQFNNGSWHFDHTQDGGRCNGYCRNPGKNGSSTGATAMALLAFYGAGYTHRSGPHQEPLNRGLYYLIRRILQTEHGADLQEGTMYAQGLSAIALCEAYAMTGDESLRPFAEQAIRFILYAQDKKGGGWRYSPGEPGDTTMHGWQLMALKSAMLAGIRVPSPAWHLAGEFLDSVQADGGAAYGYRTPQRLPTTSAVGLLCRMYMGWEHEREALARGVAYLDRSGPSKTNIYYNYYATQVMSHYGGSPWKRWNAEMREHLIATQAAVGHEAGSWHFADQHGDVGGRLYTTAMAVMTLEVYYRYMPLYGERAVNESF